MDRSVTDFNVRLRTIGIKELIIGIILTVIISGVLMGIFPEISESDELFFIVFLLIGMLFFVWAFKGTQGLDRNIENLFENKNQKEIIYVFAINILFAFLFTFLISSLDILMGLADPTWISIWEVDTVNIDSSVVILDAIGAIIFAPIMEELIFRGILFNRMKIRIGIIPAMIISSFIFAIGHEFGGMTSAFLFGICMCMLYLKTDNILIPMSVHFINNVVATILNISGLDVAISQLPWLIPCLIVSIIGTVYLVKYIIKEYKVIKTQYG
ncbi:CPBP family intramembrane glutamic endopeptidase [Methanobrevibacter sp.]|uniref:CPBP family intramembrane glutamic endopeptidase n=1 Tax=Methanobrevibacter sp. TaxID=66852 RepID=UPI0025F28309|nr:type II CAAX endopeptidase family protein [Methanobrevibacter sp.]MBR4448255.1 CPBP family intramembrane metalloprotease [Methanobrevibacter sp.]